MFNKKIDINYCYICFIVFSIVLWFSNNIITYGILLLIVFISNVKKQTKLIDISFILTFISLFVALLFKNFFLLKIMIIMDYLLYFLNIDSISDFYQINDESKLQIIYENNTKRVSELLEKGEKIDEKLVNELKKKSSLELQKKEEIQLLRFKDNHQFHNYSNSLGFFYVTIHLIVLFISILIGACAI